MSFFLAMIHFSNCKHGSDHDLIVFLVFMILLCLLCYQDLETSSATQLLTNSCPFCRCKNHATGILSSHFIYN